MTDIEKSIAKLQRCFPGSYITDRNELIVHPRTNQYIILENIGTEDAIKAKVLEWLSRAAFKTAPYSQEWRNRKFHKYMRDGINAFLDTDFSEDDMELIYTYMGLACDRWLTLMFIDHDMSIEWLEGARVMKLTLYGDPRTKKNSARILQGSGGRRFVAPSAAFEEYQTGCLWQIRSPPEPISARVNVRCVYYMATRRKVDLANLIEATCDILVKAGMLADDNSRIVAAHDGSRVDYDKKNPRAEIWIEEMEDKNG